MAAPNLTLARLREILDYEPDTGHLIWRVRTSNRITVGRIAGSAHCAGYIQVCIDGQMFLGHRVAWFHIQGTWPAFEIDHLNGVRTDNRLVNLRDVPAAVNMQNLRRASTRSRSGILGVSWSHHSQKWTAQISLNNQQRNLGMFDSIEEAQAVYLSEKRRLHPGCTI